MGKGLDYLHGQQMFHGDLKGVRLLVCYHLLCDCSCSLDLKANILINCDDHACIADFGLLAITPDQANFISKTSHSGGGTLQWMSPELLYPERFGLKESCPTKESDCYALGMVIYEVLSRQAPFGLCKGIAAGLKVMEGERPARPRGTQAAWFTDDLWGMLERCWKHQPGDRPSLETLLHCLEGVKQPSRPPSPTPTMHKDAMINSDDSLDFTATSRSTFSIFPQTSSRLSNHSRAIPGPAALLYVSQSEVNPIQGDEGRLRSQVGASGLTGSGRGDSL